MYFSQLESINRCCCIKRKLESNLTATDHLIIIERIHHDKVKNVSFYLIFYFFNIHIYKFFEFWKKKMKFIYKEKEKEWHALRFARCQNKTEINTSEISL